MKKATPTRLPDRKKTGRLHQELPLHLMLLPGLVIILIYNYAPMFGLGGLGEHETLFCLPGRAAGDLQYGFHRGF